MNSNTPKQHDLCSNKLKDANFHLSKLVRKDYKLYATVAPEGSANPKKFDFPGFNDGTALGKRSRFCNSSTSRYST